MNVFNTHKFYSAIFILAIVFISLGACSSNKQAEDIPKSQVVATESTTKIATQAKEKPKNTESAIDLRPLNDYKYIAFTFDDGPVEKNDQRLLELFEQFKGQATFFVNGLAAENHPEILVKINEQGSEIGNHTYSHPFLTELDEETMLIEVEKLNDIIVEFTDVQPVFVRPPYGEFDQLTLDALPYPLVTWNQSSRDWEKQDVAWISENILNTSAGSIILCHSTINETIQAIEETLPILYEQGYRFVTLSDLFEIYEVEPLAHHIYWFPSN